MPIREKVGIQKFDSKLKRSQKAINKVYEKRLSQHEDDIYNLDAEENVLASCPSYLPSRRSSSPWSRLTLGHSSRRSLRHRNLKTLKKYNKSYNHSMSSYNLDHKKNLKSASRTSDYGYNLGIKSLSSVFNEFNKDLDAEDKKLLDDFYTPSNRENLESEGLDFFGKTKELEKWKANCEKCVKKLIVHFHDNEKFMDKNFSASGSFANGKKLKKITAGSGRQQHGLDLSLNPNVENSMDKRLILMKQNWDTELSRNVDSLTHVSRCGERGVSEYGNCETKKYSN